MRIPGPKVFELRQALLEAFSPNELIGMLREKLEIRQSDLTFGEGQIIRVEDLIDHFNRLNEIEILVNRAKESNPKAPLLAEFARQLKESVRTESSSDYQSELLKALLDAFNRDEFKNLLRALGVRLDDITYGHGNVSTFDEVITLAKKEEWLFLLVSEACQARRNDPRLKALFDRLRSNLSADLIAICEANDESSREQRRAFVHERRSQNLLLQFKQLSSSEGIYLSRIINPPDRFDPRVVTTVWVAARGEDQYIIESIRIKDWMGMPLGPSGGPALPLDAEYQFTFGEGTDRTHALSPALTIGPNTRPYASFNLCLTPDTVLYTWGHLMVTLYYHAISGKHGTLMLKQPAKTGVMLAKHLQEDICISIPHAEYQYFEEVISPDGYQKGYEPEFHTYPQYIPIEMSNLRLNDLSSRNTILILRGKLIGFLQARERLHSLLISDRGMSQLAQWLAQGNEFAADLLGGIVTEKATTILLKALSREPTNRGALSGLCLRHFITGDDVLAEYTFSHKEVLLEDHQLYEPLFIASLLRPTEQIADVVKIIKEGKPHYDTKSINSAFRMIKDDLSEEVFFSGFNPAFGPLANPLFVRGTMNDWGCHVNAQLLYKGQGQYEVSLPLQATRYEFKIADQRWMSETNFGLEAPNQAVDLDVPHRLSTSKLSHNLVLDLSEAQAGLYRFVFDSNDSISSTLTISYVTP